MRTSANVGRAVGLAAGLGIGAAVFAGAGAAWAAPESGSPSSTSRSADAGPSRVAKKPGRSGAAARSVRSVAPAAGSQRTAPKPAAAIVGAVSVDVPDLPVRKGRSFIVSRDAIAETAARYVDSGGSPADSARFFFGDLAVTSLDELAAPNISRDQVRTRLGNLAVSGYFGGIWLRDNLRDNPTATAATSGASAQTANLTASAVAIKIFDGLATGLTAAASEPNWVVRAVAHASVPVLLALYGYNRGYLQVILDNPPAGVPSMQDTLSCNGFLDCNSSAFPLAIATRYDSVLSQIADPSTLGWREMALWTTVLEGATNAGRSVWENIAAEGAFSPNSYAALVDLSSAYLMVSKAAVLSSMLAAAGGDTSVGRSSLRLQAGLWMWSGSYFGGLASTAPTGTLPSIKVT
ncbi:MAG: hypothetical protein KDB71_04920 [Mycobacterium sp.]|nr:hypothetical protein [Mycobacterium sp.]